MTFAPTGAMIGAVVATGPSASSPASNSLAPPPGKRSSISDIPIHAAPPAGWKAGFAQKKVHEQKNEAEKHAQAPKKLSKSGSQDSSSSSAMSDEDADKEVKDKDKRNSTRKSTSRPDWQDSKEFPRRASSAGSGTKDSARRNSAEGKKESPRRNSQRAFTRIKSIIKLRRASLEIASGERESTGSKDAKESKEPDFSVAVVVKGPGVISNKPMEVVQVEEARARCAYEERKGSKEKVVRRRSVELSSRKSTLEATEQDLIMPSSTYTSVAFSEQDAPLSSALEESPRAGQSPSPL